MTACIYYDTHFQKAHELCGRSEDRNGCTTKVIIRL